MGAVERGLSWWNIRLSRGAQISYIKGSQMNRIGIMKHSELSAMNGKRGFIKILPVCKNKIKPFVF